MRYWQHIETGVTFVTEDGEDPDPIDPEVTEITEAEFFQEG